MLKNKTQKIALTAMLIALNMVYITFMVTIIIEPYWSFTPFSHIFVMLGTFLSPFVGIFTTIGTTIAFFIKTYNPLITIRAGSHIFFMLLLVLLLAKMPLKNWKNIIIVNVLVGLVHAAFEMLCAYLAVPFGIIPAENLALETIIYSCGIATFAHSVVDFFAAYGIMMLLKKYRVADFYDYKNKLMNIRENMRND